MVMYISSGQAKARMGNAVVPMPLAPPVISAPRPDISRMPLPSLPPPGVEPRPRFQDKMSDLGRERPRTLRFPKSAPNVAK